LRNFEDPKIAIGSKKKIDDLESILSGNAKAMSKEKMSPIRHSTLCKSMKIDVKGCKRNRSRDGCNVLKNC